MAGPQCLPSHIRMHWLKQTYLALGCLVFLVVLIAAVWAYTAGIPELQRAAWRAEAKINFFLARLFPAAPPQQTVG
jgi:hypothetical protein